MSRRTRHSPSQSSSDGSLNSSLRNTSIEASQDLRDKWPAGVSMGGRISVSPPDSIAKIPEMSPPVVALEEEGDSNDGDSFSGDLGQVEQDTSDGNPVYQPTTSPLRTGKKRLRKSSDSSLLGLLPAAPPSSPADSSTECDAGSRCTAFAANTRQWFRDGKNCITSIDFSRRQWIIMFVLSVVTLTSSFAVCLFPPFFPKIAQSKGASTTVFGLIIGTNCLVAFLVTPTVGKNLEKIGVKFSFVMGAFASGCCCILSGFLEWFPSGWEFVLEAVLIRAVHAFSNAFVITSTFAFIVVEFPDNIAKMFALTRATMNMAQMLGPVVGGALYELGGFKLPFLVLGSVQIAVSLLCIKALPHYRHKAGQKERQSNRTVCLADVLKIPGMWISFCTFIFSTMSNGFLSITLEPLVLRQFNISHLHVGFLFGLKDGANSLASPFWGFLCDRTKNLRPLILISSVLAAASFVLLGPMPGLPFESTHTIVVIALVINGFGIGGQQVAGVVHAMNMAVDGNLPDDAATHGFIAGLWSSLSGAGRFISRAGSGFLVDQIGFRCTTVIVVFLHCIVFIVTLSFIIGDRVKRKKEGHDSEDVVPRQHLPQCSIAVCVCQAPAVISTIGTTTPSESMGTKAMSMAIPIMPEDMEGSMVYGSVRSSRPTSSTILSRPTSPTAPHQDDLAHVLLAESP